MFQLHKLEKSHYYAIMTALAYAMGFSGGILVYNQPLNQALFSGIWTAMTVFIFTVITYEVGIKRRRG